MGTIRTERRALLHAPSASDATLHRYTRTRLGVWTVAHPTHRWLIIAIFAYFIFSPVLGIIPSMKQPAVIVVLWVIIGAHTRVASHTRGEPRSCGLAT